MNGMAAAAVVMMMTGAWDLEREYATPEPVRGAARVGEGWWTWGEVLRSWNPRGGSTLRGRFRTREGGCVVDVNRDGQLDLVAQTEEGLMWFEAPRFRGRLIDRGAVMFDCREAELLGHRGVLVVHRGMQVRLYEYADGRWPYRELYSFYTASEQGGLLLKDIDRDGRTDIVCGNYWIRSPEEYELPWRLYAINLYHETENAATAKMAFRGEDLVWLESRRAPGRVVVFKRPPGDPKVLWEAQRFAEASYPRAVVVLGSGEVVIGENNGAGVSRVRMLEGAMVGEGRAVFELFEWRGRVVGVGEKGVYFWRR